MQTSVTQEQMAETMEWLRATLQSGVDFTTEQAPLWAEEMLRYGAYSNRVGLWICAIVAAAGTFMFVLGCINKARASSWDGEGWLMTLSVGALFVVAAFAIGLPAFLELKKIEQAPRVYLLEHLPRI